MSPGDRAWRPVSGLLQVCDESQLFLLPPGAPSPIALDPQGAELWTALMERDLADIVAWLASRDGVPPAEVEAGLQQFVDDLAGVGALTAAACVRGV